MTKTLIELFVVTLALTGYVTYAAWTGTQILPGVTAGSATFNTISAPASPTPCPSSCNGLLYTSGSSPAVVVSGTTVSASWQCEATPCSTTPTTVLLVQQATTVCTTGSISGSVALNTTPTAVTAGNYNYCVYYSSISPNQSLPALQINWTS